MPLLVYYDVRCGVSQRLASHIANNESSQKVNGDETRSSRFTFPQSQSQLKLVVVQYSIAAVTWRAGNSRSSAHRPWQESTNRFRRRHSTAQHSTRLRLRPFLRSYFLCVCIVFFTRDTLPAVQTSTVLNLSHYRSRSLTSAVINYALCTRTMHFLSEMYFSQSYKEFSLQIILKSKSYMILTIFIQYKNSFYAEILEQTIIELEQDPNDPLEGRNRVEGQCYTLVQE